MCKLTEMMQHYVTQTKWFRTMTNDLCELLRSIERDTERIAERGPEQAFKYNSGGVAALQPRGKEKGGDQLPRLVFLTMLRLA